MADKYNFKIETDLKYIQQADLIFASEYFEHFYKPVDHLREVLSLNPKALIIANAFGTISLGHFIEYEYNGKLYSGKEISKIFNYELIKNGYRKIKTHLWNNRPNYWKKNEA